MKIPLNRVYVFIISIVYSSSSIGQGNYVDSLKKVLSAQKEDTNKVKTLRALDLYFLDANDSVNFLFYANEVVSFSKKIGYNKGIGNGYRDLGYFYLNEPNNYAIALKYFIASFNIRKQTHDYVDIANGYYNLACCYWKLHEYGDAFNNANEALSRFGALDSLSSVADTYTIMGQMYSDQGNYPEETKSYYAALKIYDRLDDKPNIGSTLQYIGSEFEDQGNYPEALTNLKAALNVRKQTNDKGAIAQTLITIGTIYINDTNYSEAINYHLQGLQLFKEAGKNAPDWGLAFAYQSLGIDYEGKADIYFASDDKKSATDNLLQALQYHLRALSEYKKIHFVEGISSTDMKLGNLYLKLNRMQRAKYYLQESIAGYKSINTIPAIRSAYLAQTTQDSINGNMTQALQDYKIAMNYQFAMFNNESNKKIMESKLQYDFDKKAALGMAEQNKKDLDAKRIKNRQYFAIASLGIVALAVILIASIQYRNNDQKQKANNLLQHEKEKVESTLQELKSTQKQLIQSEKMASLGELTAGIAHEIQNPLNFVNNFSDINNDLLTEMRDELSHGNIDEAKNLAGNVIENESKIAFHGKRAEAIVKAMLQHSRKNTGQRDLADINAICDEYIRLSYHGLRAKDKEFNAEIKTDFDTSIGKINIVSQDIGRALMNLINNAFYAVNEKAKIQSVSGEIVEYKPSVIISTKSKFLVDGGLKWIEIKVADNGGGIPQNIFDKIFQPFFTAKPPGSGTGLGLSLAYDIVKAHNGEIKVETTDGEGTIFTIQLPASS